MQLYFAPIRTGTSDAYDEGRDVTQISKTVGLDKRVSADSGPRKVREMTCYHSEDAGEALGKPIKGWTMATFVRWMVMTFARTSSY